MPLALRDPARVAGSFASAGYDGGMRRSISRYVLLLLSLAGCEKPKTYTAQEVRSEPIAFGSSPTSRIAGNEFATPRTSDPNTNAFASSGTTREPSFTGFESPASSSAGGPPTFSLEGVADDFGFPAFGNPLSVTVDALVQSGQAGSGVERTRREMERLFKEGVEHLERGRFDQARFQFEKMQATDPNDVRGFIGAGETYLRRNEIGPALAVFEIASRTHPEDASLNFAQARAYLTINNLTRADEYLTKVLSKSPDYADARWMRGIVNLRRRNPRAMDADAEALMRILPKGPEGFLLKAISQGMLGDLEEGRKWYLRSEKMGLPKQAIDVWRPQFFPRGAP